MEGILHSGAASVAMLHLEAGKLVCLSKEFEFNRLDYQHNVSPSLPVLEVKGSLLHDKAYKEYLWHFTILAARMFTHKRLAT